MGVPRSGGGVLANKNLKRSEFSTTKLAHKHTDINTHVSSHNFFITYFIFSVFFQLLVVEH